MPKAIIKFKTNSIYYFTIQEDDPIGFLMQSILKFFNLADYHLIVNTSNDSVIGFTVRQILLVPAIYRIINVQTDELKLKTKTKTFTKGL